MSDWHAKDGCEHCADFDLLAGGVVWQDAEGHIVDANPAAAPLLGLSRDELLGRTSKDPRWYAVHEDGSPWPGSEHPGMVALRTGLPQRARIMGIMAPGAGRRWICIAAIPQFAPGLERPVGVVASFFDMTRELESRARLQAEADELAEIYNQAPCGYHMLDTTGRYLRINDTALAWLGVAREMAVGRLSPRDFMTGHGKHLFDTHFPRILRGETLEDIELEMRSADGRLRWLRLNARPVLDAQGRVIATRSVLQDVTEQHDSRLAQDQVFEEMRRMLDNDLVAIVRLRGRRIVWTNRAFAHMFGYESGELLDRDSSMLYPDLAGYEAFGREAYAALGAGDSYRAQLELRRKDGSAVWADCSGALLDARAGESIWFSKDVTAQRQEQALLLRTTELEAENRRLHDMSRLQSAFLANVSHELRTPLNAVMGFAQLLQRMPEGEDIARRQRYLAQIGHSGQHLLALIDSLLTLARAQAGHLPLRPCELQARSVIDETVAMLEGRARDHGVHVRIDVAPDLPMLRLDPMRLKQVLVNYLGNAIKFSNHGGDVIVRCTQPSPQRVLFEVEDFGIGIAPEDQERLFTRFYQVSTGHAKRYEGTGIGLSLVKLIVEAQGGTVGVRSVPGRGSVFWALLPTQSTVGTLG